MINATRQNRAKTATAMSFCAAVVFIISASAAAAPIVDGRFDASEGYSLGRYVDFSVQGSGTTVTGGELWTYQDAATGDVYVLFTQPLTLVDNTYGDNSIGWGRSAPSGKRHNFRDLVGSDAAQFTFTNALGQTVLDVDVDYISRDGGDYRSLGVTGGDGEVHTGSAASVLAWGTSLDYNFNTLGYVLTEDSPATDDDYTPNPAYPGWVFEVSYELKISGSAFGPSGFGDVSLPIVHDSPNKIGKNKVYPRVDGQIPEPGSLSLLCFGAALVAWRKFR